MTERPTPQDVAKVTFDEADVRARVALALLEAAADPALRLSGHSGISVTRLRERALSIVGGSDD